MAELHGTPGASTGGAAFYTGLCLMAVSWALWLPLPLLPLLPVSGTARAGLGVGLVAVAELAFWVGVALAGREAVQRMRARLRGVLHGSARGEVPGRIRADWDVLPPPPRDPSAA